MFSDNDATPGKLLVCDIKHIQNMEVLTDLDAMQQLLGKICNKYDFHVISKNSHLFDGCGFTLLWMLSESHLSIHTFPERQYLAFDIYTCRHYSDNSVYEEIYQFLVSELDASNCHYSIIDRSFS